MEADRVRGSDDLQSAIWLLRQRIQQGPVNRDAMTKFEHKAPMDFVIVGGGGAGGVVAKELSTAGFQLVVLEQGPYIRPEEFVHDELRFRDPYNPPHIGREVLTNDHALQPNTFRHNENEKAIRQPA